MADSISESGWKALAVELDDNELLKALARFDKVGLLAAIRELGAATTSTAS